MKNYNSIDLSKFIMAYFVVAIHTGYDKTIITKYICPLVVPIFFIISGFFIYKKIYKDHIYDKKELNNYTLKIFKMYLLWTILYLPFSYYGYCVMERKSIIRGTLIILRNSITSGQNYMSWPLWYLFSLMTSCFLFKILKSLKIKIEIIFLFCSVIYIVLFIYPLPQVHSLMPIVGFINELFYGSCFITIGMCISKWYHRIKNNYVIIICIITYVIYIITRKYFIVECVASPALVYFIIKIKLKDNKPLFIAFRKMSTLIFLSHMFFVAPLIIFYYHCKEGSSLFYISCLLVTIFSILLIVLMEKKHFYFLKKLLGR